MPSHQMSHIKSTAYTTTIFTDQDHKAKVIKLEYNFTHILLMCPLHISSEHVILEVLKEFHCFFYGKKAGVPSVH